MRPSPSIASISPVGWTRKIQMSQVVWLTISAPSGTPAAYRAHQWAPATPAAPIRVKLPVTTWTPP